MTMTQARTSASTALIVPPQGLSVWMLRWWHQDTDERQLFLSYDEGLHHLAALIREDWDEERDEPPASDHVLTDGQVVSLFYGGELGLSPSSGERGERGVRDHRRVRPRIRPWRAGAASGRSPRPE